MQEVKYDRIKNGIGLKKRRMVFFYAQIFTYMGVEKVPRPRLALGTPGFSVLRSTT
jgi:hypothetical protein